MKQSQLEIQERDKNTHKIKNFKGGKDYRRKKENKHKHNQIEYFLINDLFQKN